MRIVLLEDNKCIMQERGFIKPPEMMETLFNETLDNENIETLFQATPNQV